jgi:hypothetical protein
VDTPFERRESTDLVVVDATTSTYLLANTGFGFLGLGAFAFVPWSVLCAGSAMFLDPGAVWHLWLGGDAVIAAGAAAGSLAWGVHSRRHVLRLEFSPADNPEVVRLVRAVGSTRLPLSRVQLVKVVSTETAPWGPDDPDPASTDYVTVELHTAAGVEQMPPNYRMDPDHVAARLGELLSAAGVPVERERVVRGARTRQIDLDAWWLDRRVAADWGVPPEQVPWVAHRLRVERLQQHYSMYNPGITRYNPADVERVTAAIADGSLARAAAGELLSEVHAAGRPLAPRPTPGNEALAAFLSQDQATAFAARAQEPDRARRVLAGAVLGEPAPDDEPLGETVRRALRRRPNLPYGRSDIAITA